MDIRGGELDDIVPGVLLVEILLVLLVLLHLGLTARVEEGRGVARIAVVDTRRKVDILVGTLAVTVAR